MPDIDLSRSLGPSYFTLPIYLGQALDQTGQVFFFNQSSALATSIKSGNTTAAIDYTLPTEGPSSSGYLLSSSTTGILSWIASTPSKLVQIVMATASSGLATTTNSYTTTNLTGSITPTSASNKILVLAWGTIRNSNGAAANAYYTLFRDSTDLGAGSGDGFGRLNVTFIGPCSMGYLDSPATASAITYSVKIKNDDNVTSVVFGTTGTQVLIMAEVSA